MNLKEIIRNGKISLLMPEGEGGALSGEAHLLLFKRKKYVLRKCPDSKKAKMYLLISKRLEKYDFLPKLIGKSGNNVVYEYIEGRDLRQNEKIDVFRQLGVICAHINQMQIKASMDKGFYQRLKELETGKYIPYQKVILRRQRSGITEKPKAVLSHADAAQIKKLYSLLKRKAKPKITLNPADVVPGNFRLRNKRVYLVDVESVKPNFNGSGLAKFFLGWGKDPKRQKAFKSGYQSIASMSFINETYKDLLYLNFSITALHFKAQVIRDYSEDIELIRKMIEKYL